MIPNFVHPIFIARRSLKKKKKKKRLLWLKTKILTNKKRHKILIKYFKLFCHVKIEKKKNKKYLLQILTNSHYYKKDQ